MNKLWKFCFVACSMLGAGSVQAIKVEPGQWAIEVEGSRGMSGTLMAHKKTECITEADYDPTRAALMMDSMCTVGNQKETGNTLTWTVECSSSNPGMPGVKGNGRFISEGRKASGDMVMKLDFAGREMTQVTRWNGRWISDDCNKPDMISR